MTTHKITSVTEFLLARIADDEAAARAEMPESRSNPPKRFHYGADPYLRPRCRHDPARVLAECAAKRAIVEMFDPECPDLDPFVGVSVIRMLAAVYAEHDEYQAEWKVGV